MQQVQPMVGNDLIEVWVCRIPADSANPWFAPGGLRLPLDADEVAAELGVVADYFARVSNGRYRPGFLAGGEVDADEGGPEQCADRALAASRPEASAVLVVEDAEHAADHPGGWGRPGNGCAGSCPARRSRRAVVVGGADFHPDWAGRPPLDLVEHELGHSLGWGHSTRPESVGVTGWPGGTLVDLPSPDAADHANPFDLMSDSVAVRRVDPEARDGPTPIGVHRLLAGWIDLESGTVKRLIAVAGDTAELGPGEVLLVDLGDGRSVLTVEAVDPALRPVAPGVVVHLVEVGSRPPVVELAAGVLADSARWSGSGVAIVVRDAGAGRFAVTVGSAG